jgi:hypothetical protein
VRKETFERFVQYAYTGDYSIPKTEKRNTAEANGIHPKTPDQLAKPEKTENFAVVQSPLPNTANGIRRHTNSLGSDEAPQIESVAEKMEEDGTILNYPIPSKKHKKKKVAKEKAEKELKEAALKVEKETVTQPEPKSEETHPAETQPAEPEPGPEPEPTLLTEEEKSPEQHDGLTADFQSLSYPLLASRDNYEGTCEPATNFEKGHNYSNVFLSHASLYQLGDVQLIDSLKALALFKLHKTLCAFELDDENIGDITDLARYAYSGEDKGIGGLKSLICQYMALHAVELSVDARFMNLLAGGGQIVKDFFKFQLQRIH